MKLFFRTIGLELLFVTLVIFWTDTDHIWHRHDAFAQREIRKGEVWLWPNQELSSAKTYLRWPQELTATEFRNFRLAQLELTPTPDIVFFGSSRLYFTDYLMLSPHMRPLNCWVSLEGVEDYAAFWQTLKNLHKVPPYLVIYADPWFLNREFDFGAWRMNAKLLHQFQSSRSLWYDNLCNLWSHARELISMDAFFFAVSSLHTLYLEKGSRGYLLPESRTPSHVRGLHWDGTTYSIDQLDAAELIGQPGRSDGINALSALPFKKRVQDWTLDVERQALFRAVIADMLKEKVHVMVLIPPIHPRAFHDLKRWTLDQELAHNFFTPLEHLKESLPALQVCDAFDGEKFGCSEDEFMDGYHMNRSCTEKVLRRCFRRTTAWTHILKKLE